MHSQQEPLVSIGITTYNRPESLRKALESVVNQTYRNLEILISEDCTPCERTKAILREYAARDPRVRCFHQENNLGPPRNIRFVLEQATGEYFMWADDDDIRDLTWVATLLEKFTLPDIFVAVGKVLSIDDNDRILGEVASLDFSESRVVRLVRYFLAEERHGKSNIVCGLFNLKLLRSITHWSLYRHNKYGGGDYLFSLDCIQRGKIVEAPEVRIFKRVPVYSEEFLRNEPGPVTKAFRQFRYLLDKLLLATLIPVRFFRATVFQVGQYRLRIASRFKRIFG
jgi:glycosyltransferase involved in cell wall biosynthesis